MKLFLWRKTIPVAACVLLVMFVVITYNKYEEKVDAPEGTTGLLNIVRSRASAKYSQNIFFVETLGAVEKDGKLKPGDLTKRQACSIESAAAMNPEATIFVVFLDRLFLKDSEMVQTLMAYQNIEFYRIDLHEFVIGTPVEAWIKTDKLYDSQFLKIDMSDLFRMLILWKFGGTYFDLDIILQTSIDNVGESNYACAEDEKSSDVKLLNGAIINLDTEYGRKLAELFLSDFVANYDGNKWGHNGPDLVTRVIKKLCKLDTEIEVLETYHCANFTILPKSKCYEIGWYETQFFIDENLSETTMQRVKDSYFVHFYSHITNNNVLATNSKAAYVKLAEQSCPRVLKASGDFF